MERVEYNWQLDWTLLDHDPHRKMQAYVKALNKLYVEQPALRQVDFSWEGFHRIDFHDVDDGIVSFVRRARIPTISWWCWLISRPCRGKATASACPHQGSIASSSTVTRPYTAAVMWEMPAACLPNNALAGSTSFHPAYRSTPGRGVLQDRREGASR